MIKFREQFDKIVNAYMKNELVATVCTACFVGNLLNNKEHWAAGRNVFTGRIADLEDSMDIRKARLCILNEGGGMYTHQEILDLERIFLTTLQEGKNYNYDLCIKGDNFEARLFNAMEVTLEHLKQLHILKGEIIEDEPIFTKRQLIEEIV